MYQQRSLRQLIRYAVDMRVLGRIRLSRLTEESTSAARQREIIEQWAQSNDHTVVGWAEDLDVSGSIDPFEAPALGPWWDRAGEWDIMCAWKLDRIGRRAIPLNKVFGWMIENHKTLVCVSDNIDLSTWVGRLVANVIAGVAEGELEAITERTKASRRKLLESGRWPGGMVPRGYRPVELPTGGYRLEVDPLTQSEVLRMVHDVIAGKTVDQLGKELGQHPSGLWKVLESPNLLGHATYEGKTVRDREGRPVLWGDPLLSQQEWNDLQTALAARRRAVSRRSGVSPLQGVGFCLVCGTQLFHRRFKRDYGNGVYRYYYCRNKHGRNIPAEQAEELVFDTFLEDFGDDPVLERVYRPAENHQIELEEAVRAVDELTALAGTMTSATMRSRLTEQLRALDSEMQRLEQLPNRPAGWDYKETGSTFKSVWETSSLEEKRLMVIDKEITARLIREEEQIEFYIVTQKSPSA
jgi:site-specific DNA recombinase